MRTWLLLEHVVYNPARVLYYVNSQVPNPSHRRIAVSTEGVNMLDLS